MNTGPILFHSTVASTVLSRSFMIYLVTALYILLVLKDMMVFDLLSWLSPSDREVGRGPPFYILSLLGADGGGDTVTSSQSYILR